MRLITSNPEGSRLAIDEAPRGGIGSRLKVHSCDEVEGDGGHRTGLGMGPRTKVSTAAVVLEMFAQTETPGGKGQKRRNEGDEGGMNRKPKKKGRKRAQVASDRVGI